MAGTTRQVLVPHSKELFVTANTADQAITLIGCSGANVCCLLWPTPQAAGSWGHNFELSLYVMGGGVGGGEAGAPLPVWCSVCYMANTSTAARPNGLAVAYTAGHCQIILGR